MADTTAVAIYKLGLETQDYVRSAQQAKQANEGLVASAEKLAVSEEKVNRATRTSADEISRTVAKLDGRTRAEKALQTELARVQRWQQEGIGSAKEQAQVIDLATMRYQRQIAALHQQEAAMRKSSTTTGLARHEMINLSRQIQDIGVSLAGGQSPFRILIEQGSQIIDIFASSKAAFGDVFRNMIAWAARSATSIIGVVTAVAGLGVAAGALAIQWLATQQSVERSLIGIGERAGLTVKQVNEIAEAASKQGKLSRPSALGAAEEFIKTGKMYQETVTAATNITDKFALAMGVSAADAAKQLADILSDTNKGAETLDKSFGFLDGKTRELIRSLNAQNKSQEAMLVLLNAVEPAIRKAAEASSIWAQMWLFLTQSLRGFVDTTGREIVALIDLWRGVTTAVNESVAAMAEAYRRGREFAPQREEGRERQGSPGRVAVREMREPSPAAAPAIAPATIKPAIDELVLYKKALDDAAASRDRLFGLEAEAAVNALIPQIQQLKNLEKTLNDVKRAQESGAVSGGMAAGMVANLKAAADAGEVLQRTLTETQAATERANAAALGLADKYKGVGLEVAKTLSNLDGQINVAAQLTGQAKIYAQEQARITQLTLEGKSAQEAVAIASKETLLAQTQLATQHKNNMGALEDQLAVARARTESEQLSAQYEADINSRLREGATLMQAEEEAAMKRAIAEENLQKQRSAAYQKQLAAERQHEEAIVKFWADMWNKFIQLGVKLRESFEAAGSAMELAAKLATIGTGAAKVSMPAGTGFARPGDVVHTQVGGGGPLIGAAGAGGIYNPDFAGRARVDALYEKIAKQQADFIQKQKDALQKLFDEMTPGTDEYTRKQEEAAQKQIEAANLQKEAAEEAKRAREAYINQLDEAVKDIVATKLLAGQSAQAVNLLIEQGAIQFGTASTRFQTQLDLYKRAGMSNAQIAADIRSGVIGEGVRPSELLAALDSLTDAVDANTDAQLGLSPFYTSQGDRQLGYRGYTVQRGASNIPGTLIGGTGIGTGTGTGTGTGGGGIGTIGGGGMGGGMGGIINPPSQVAEEFIPGPIGPGGTVILRRILNGMVVDGYYDVNGQWVTTQIYTVAPGMTRPADTAGVPVTGGAPTTSFGRIGSSIPTGPAPSSAYSRFQEGGIADRATFGIFGEAGPEAFVPLKGGAIPVRFAANQNRPTNVININAPLVHFAAEPTRDEVRQSAFQAAQMLRRAVG